MTLGGILLTAVADWFDGAVAIVARCAAAPRQVTTGRRTL